MGKPTSEELLSRVKEYAKRAKSRGGRCSIQDYERYKHMFQDNDLYGYESQIAKILHV